jgi:hypothetical protein
MSRRGGSFRSMGRDLPADHTCPTPGWYARWCYGVKPNAVWVCDCGQWWQWTMHPTDQFSNEYYSWVTRGDDS